MTVPPLPIGEMWRDTLADTRALLPLTWPVAAALVLLPGVAVDLFGPRLPATVAEFTPRIALIDSLLPALVGLIAQVAIVRLALDRRRGVVTSVGDALLVALRLWPLAIATTILSGLSVTSGLLLLVVPGLYVVGRLAVVLPLVADGTGPVAALEASWAMTEGNGWRALAFTLLFVGWFVIVGAAVGLLGAGVATVIGGAVGSVAASVVQGVAAALFTVLDAVGVATLYRALCGRRILR